MTVDRIATTVDATAAPYPVEKPRQPARRTIESLQWLRCLAATLVVIYHVEVQLFRLNGDHVNNMGFGAAGVDLFFVITGFIMVYVTQKRPPSFGGFMLRRAVRIVPLYWLFTCAMLGVLLVAPALLHSSQFDAGHVISSFLFIPYGHPVLGPARPLLVPGWTLNYEMFFYVLYGAFLFLALPMRIAAIGAVLTALIAAWLAGVPSALVAFYGEPIVLEFIAGMLIAYLYFEKDRLPLRVITGVLLAGAAVSAAAIQNGISEQSERAIYWGVAAACFVLAAVFVERTYGWPDSPLLRHLGDASYSTYLSHLFVITAITLAVRKTGTFALLGTMGTRAVMVVSALAAGSAIHRFIERPMIDAAGALLRRTAPAR